MLKKKVHAQNKRVFANGTDSWTQIKRAQLTPLTMYIISIEKPNASILCVLSKTMIKLLTHT